MNEHQISNIRRRSFVFPPTSVRRRQFRIMHQNTPHYCTKRVFKSFVSFFQQIPPSPQSTSQLALHSRSQRYQYKYEDGKYPTCRTHRIWTLKGETSNCCDRWSSCKMKWVLCKNRHECNRPLRNWTINCGTPIREFHSFFGFGNTKLPQKNTDELIYDPSIVRHLREDTSCLVNPAITVLWRLWYKSLTLFYRLEQWRGRAPVTMNKNKFQKSSENTKSILV